jgi:REP element-mobilizing transposase RayT
MSRAEERGLSRRGAPLGRLGHDPPAIRRAAGFIPAVWGKAHPAGINPAARLDGLASLSEFLMVTDRPFALHITWTCYGTWLPGDQRGYVANTRLPEGGWQSKQNTPGTPYDADDACTRRQARALQKAPGVRLSGEEALWTAQALVEAARARTWRIWRGAVMANHVHVVITDCPDDGPAVRRVLKGGSQAALSRAAGRRQRWWTAGGSDRYKHDHAAIEAALDTWRSNPECWRKSWTCRQAPSPPRGASGGVHPRRLGQGPPRRDKPGGSPG